ncbi:transmembrane anchor protein, partial [Pseudomonas veronii]
DGTHGWFWRNRSNNDVTIALKTNGDYLSVKQ